MNITIGREH